MNDVKDIVKDMSDKDKKNNVRKDYSQFYDELEKLVPESMKLELEFLFRCMRVVPASIHHFIVKDLYENVYLKSVD
jgi:hypothetical protein